MKDDAQKLMQLVAEDPLAIDYGLNKIEKLLSKSPNDVDYLQVKGNFLQIKGESLKALQCFKKAEQIDPKNIEIIFNIADYYDYHEEPEQFQAAFHQLLEIISKQYNELTGNIHYVLDMVETYSEIYNDKDLSKKTMRVIKEIGMLIGADDRTSL